MDIGLYEQVGIQDFNEIFGFGAPKWNPYFVSKYPTEGGRTVHIYWKDFAQKHKVKRPQDALYALDYTFRIHGEGQNIRYGGDQEYMDAINKIVKLAPHRMKKGKDIYVELVP